MKKFINRSTPVSILLNVILIINCLIVLYPVLFTISSSFSVSSSLAASSVIPFTSQKDTSTQYDCEHCNGTGLITPDNLNIREVIDGEVTVDVVYNKSEGEAVEAEPEVENANVSVISEESHQVECPECNGSGKITKVSSSFKFKKPSLYQYRRLLTDSDKYVKLNPAEKAQNVKPMLGTNYKHWYFNTLKIACLNTFLTVIICTLAGYIFSRFQFTGRKQIMASMIVLQMFPSFIGMVATYVILWKFNALNTLWGLVLVYSAGSIPFNSQLMKGYFDTMPKDIAEAAYIDGASPLVAFIRVILPAAKPQIVFLTLTSFTGPWMDYIFPRMVLRSDDKKTLAVGLYEMISGRSNDNFTMFAAGAILVAVPFAILFMAGQKTLLLSLAGTSGKE